MKGLLITALAVAGSGLGVSKYLAQTTDNIDETVTVSREGIVVVRIPTGIVHVRGWDTNALRVTGSAADPDRVEIATSRGTAEVRVVPDLGSDGAVRLTLDVPRGSSLDIETDDATVEIDGVDGMVRMESVTGDLALRGRPLGILARSAEGDIDVGPGVGRGFAYSEDGKVTLRGEAQDAVMQRDYRRERRFRTATHQYDFSGLGHQIQSLVQRAMERVDVTGNIDIDRHDRGFRFNVTGDVEYDPEDLADLFDDLEEFLWELEGEIGAGMEQIGEELRDLGRDFRRGRSN